MPFIDLHSDILVDVVWRRAHGEHRVMEERHCPALRKAGINALGLTIWIELDQTHRAAARTREVINALEAELRESPGALALVRTPAEAEAAMRTGKLAILLTIEGMAALDEDPALFSDLCDLGLTSGLMTWNEANAFASGFPGYHYAEARTLSTQGNGSWLTGLNGPGEGEVQGLTAKGRALLKQMADAGVMLDLSHLNEKTFWEAIAAYPGTGVFASHSNARSICSIPRNLSDDQIKAIAERDGIIGLNAFSAFVDPDRPGIDRFIDHAVYIADLVGVHHLGFGFDFIDYLEAEALESIGGTLPRNPELHGAADVPPLVERMEQRGFSPSEIEAITWGNFARVWRSAILHSEISTAGNRNK
ncbi:membrane dipeptidase [Fictibacillus enclensis]|uniref:dipeptidase n=1 Tax=Fictibacillus enclensis TaxID=1017270 RepID=UPI00259FFF92|nr:membrane dipeptidase [Fictibacillus enclensis]MDM5196723.1 membrane dipeptidase [Fictibacillus enclensis]